MNRPSANDTSMPTPADTTTAATAASSDDWVTLVSSDAFSFTLSRACAVRSGTIRRMLDAKSGFREAVTGVCHFENIVGVVLEKVCEYLLYNERYHDQTSVPDMEIPPELSLELALASDYLDC